MFADHYHLPLIRGWALMHGALFIVFPIYWRAIAHSCRCVAIVGSKFKAVNHRDRNFTSGKMRTRLALTEQSIGEYLTQLDRMNRK